MKLNAFLGLLMFFSISMLPALSQPQGFDKWGFYTILENGSADDIDLQLKRVNASDLIEKEAYSGTLLMKKAELLSKAKDKLKTFKSGHAKLESAILKDNANTEYRFLRLIIQEHAPKVVKYRKEIRKDSQMIRTNFKSLAPVLQEIIIDYSKKSKVLKTLKPQFLLHE